MMDTGFTVLENELLNMLAAGELDGIYEFKLSSKKGYKLWIAIVSGIPTLYIEKPVVRKIENGKLVHTLGESTSLSIWDTEEKKLEFLFTYGEIIDNPIVQSYVFTDRKPAGLFLLQPLTPEVLHKVYHFDLGHYDS